MPIKTIPSEHRLYLIGDYHQYTELFIEKLKLIKAPASLIMLGDYGVVDSSDVLLLRDTLRAFNLTVYLLRGNHDNPQFWQDRDLAEQLSTNNFYLLNEVDQLIWRGKRILTVSGAISVDRTGRRFEEGKCWPDTEGVPLDTLRRVKEWQQGHGVCDFFLSHTGLIDGLAIHNPFVDSFAAKDEKLYSDIKGERELVRKLQTMSGCRSHYFGHFHTSWKGEGGLMEKRCLDVCELVQL